MRSFIEAMKNTSLETHRARTMQDMVLLERRKCVDTNALSVIFRRTFHSTILLCSYFQMEMF